jgi:PHS family inorganic phosphate transporter-like MFS transporter
MTSPLSNMDESKIKTFHLRIVFTAGMGFFTDAYDLFIIGVASIILMPIWHLTTLQLALLNGTALGAAAIGAVFFGFLADKFGRKRLYGLEVLLLFFGAIMSALAPSFIWLLIARILVGLGIGGDYPSSAIIASEYAPQYRRGFLVLLVFAMQAMGLVVGPLLASVFLLTSLPHELVWRILLGLGAIPAASVFYLRRKIQETPRYLLSKETPVAVSRVLSDLTGVNVNQKVPVFKKQSLLQTKWLIRLLGTSLAWFFLDVAFYGNSVSSVLILKTLNPEAHLVTNTLISALIFLVCAVPGYFLAAALIDNIGRKFLQMFGFFMIAVCYGLIAFIPGVVNHVVTFLVIFGISFFFVNFGPNTTTFLIPSEIYPTSFRAKAHGISAALGKVGAFVGAFFLPHILLAHGLRYTMALLALVCIAGVLSTFLIPEMKRISLDATETF